MSKRDVRLYLHDILESINKIEEWTRGLKYADFVRDSRTVDAVIRNLEVIGEASKFVPDDLRTRFDQVPWRRVVGFRNIAIHQYADIDWNTVWTIATQRLPEIKPVIAQMLREAEAD